MTSTLSVNCFTVILPPPPFNVPVTISVSGACVCVQEMEGKEEKRATVSQITGFYCNSHGLMSGSHTMGLVIRSVLQVKCTRHRSEN